MITIISAVESGTYAIGKNNDLIYHIPADLKHFKELTTGHKIIMGLNTFNSLPVHPLPNRTNIVIAPEELHDTSYSDVIWVTSIQDAKDLVNDEEEAFVIGGGMIYKQFITEADKVELTIVIPVDKKLHTDADVFFPGEELQEYYNEEDSTEWIKYTDKNGRELAYKFTTFMAKKK